jgi:hypothetical protein
VTHQDLIESLYHAFKTTPSLPTFASRGEAFISRVGGKMKEPIAVSRKSVEEYEVTQSRKPDESLMKKGTSVCQRE